MEGVVFTRFLDPKHVEAAGAGLKEIGKVFACSEWQIIGLYLVLSKVSLANADYVLSLRLMIDCSRVHIN